MEEIEILEIQSFKIDWQEYHFTLGEWVNCYIIF